MQRKSTFLCGEILDLILALFAKGGSKEGWEYENMRMTCALTGHRDLPDAFDKNALYDALEALIRRGCDRFLCGMARGFDLAALACLADLKQRYRITLVACVPYAGQERGFS